MVNSTEVCNKKIKVIRNSKANQNRNIEGNEKTRNRLEMKICTLEFLNVDRLVKRSIRKATGPLSHDFDLNSNR